jgi:hypothetical protein
MSRNQRINDAKTYFHENKSAQTAFALAIKKAAESVTHPPDSIIDKKTIAKAIFVHGGAVAVATYSAYFSWDSSRDFGTLLNYQTGLHSDFFAASTGYIFALAGLGTNSMQAADIILEEYLHFTRRHHPEELFLLHQETYIERVKSHITMITGMVFSIFAALPLGFITKRNSGLGNGIGVGITNIPVAYRGIMNSLTRAIALTSHTTPQKIIADRILLAFDETLQLPKEQLKAKTNAFCELTNTRDIIEFLLTGAAVQDTESQHTNYPSRLHLSRKRRAFIATAILLTVPFQIGYVLEAYRAGKDMHVVMAWISAALAMLNYFGITIDASDELAREVANGRKMLGDVLAPRFFKFMRYAILLAGALSGATLAFTNWSELTRDPVFQNRTGIDSSLFDLPEPTGYIFEAGGALSDASANSFYAISLVLLWIRLYMKAYCADPILRKVALLERMVTFVSNLFTKMSPEHFNVLIQDGTIIPTEVVQKVLEQNEAKKHTRFSLFRNSRKLETDNDSEKPLLPKMKRPSRSCCGCIIM